MPQLYLVDVQVKRCYQLGEDLLAYVALSVKNRLHVAHNIVSHKSAAKANSRRHNRSQTHTTALLCNQRQVYLHHHYMNRHPGTILGCSRHLQKSHTHYINRHPGIILGCSHHLLESYPHLTSPRLKRKRCRRRTVRNQRHNFNR